MWTGFLQIYRPFFIKRFFVKNFLSFPIYPILEVLILKECYYTITTVKYSRNVAVIHRDRAFLKQFFPLTFESKKYVIRVQISVKFGRSFRMKMKKEQI